MSSATIAGSAEACCIIVCNIHKGKFLQGQIAEIVVAEKKKAISFHLAVQEKNWFIEKCTHENCNSVKLQFHVPMWNFSLCCDYMM